MTALVAAAVGIHQTLARGEALGLVRGRLNVLLNHVLAWGLVGAHLMAVLSHPAALRADPWVVLRPWDGIAAAGGIGAGAVAALVLARRRGMDGGAVLDALAYGLAPAWLVARIGCFLVHDHPGAPTRFPLAVAYPDVPAGMGRHDLGLYEVPAALLLTIAMRALARRRLPPGTSAAVFVAAYAAARLTLDGLRAVDVPRPDPRWLGWTPTQWLAFPVLAGAVVRLVRRRNLVPR